ALIVGLSGIPGVLANPATQEETPPVVLSPCEPPRPDNDGIFITYNTNIELDSELLQGLFRQATNYVRRGTVMQAQREYTQARRLYNYAIDYLNYLYDLYNGRGF